MGKVLDFDLKPKMNAPGVDRDISELTREERKAEKIAKAQAEFEKTLSVFEKTLRKERKKLKKKNQTLTDSPGNVAVLKALLKMNLKLIPTAERMFHKYRNERAAYPVVALVNQCRDLSADIQRLGGAASASPVIINTILMPNFQMLLQSTLNEGAEALKELKRVMPKKFHRKITDVMNSNIKNQTDYMSEINHAIAEKIENYFNEK